MRPFKYIHVTDAPTAITTLASERQAACTSLGEKLVSLACTHPSSPLFGSSQQQVVVENSIVRRKDDEEHCISYTDILHLHQRDMLEVMTQVQPDTESKKYTCYSFGSHFVEVHVHPYSGEVRVTRYVAAFDAGRIVNQKTACSQLTGGIIWGIGMALEEQVIRDERNGRILNADLAEYHVPVNRDIPDIDAFFVEEHDPHMNILGTKSVGEIGTVGSAAAIANAVYHATGKRIRTLPITLDKLL